MSICKFIPKTFRLGILLFVLVAMLPLGNRVGATPFVAIVVFDHGMAKGIVYATRGHIVPVNKTNSFTEDDRFAYAFFTAALSSANVTWLWYDPNGQLFLNRTQQISCDTSPCTYVYYFPLRHTDAATDFGVWTLTLEAGGVSLYSDQFSVKPVIKQYNSWRFDIERSSPPRVHGDLTVTIHPQNATWSSYPISLPYAANVTAYDSSTNRTLEINSSNSTGPMVVDLGTPRADGYKFIVSFDLRYGVSSMGLWNSGFFALRWYESTWATFGDGYHPVPGSFEVTLPQGANFVDAVGINDIALNQNVTTGSRITLSFLNTLEPTQGFGWVVLYRDIRYQNANPQPISSPMGGGLRVVQSQTIPILSVTVGSFSVWSAVMSILLLTGSEVLSPVYARTGVVINRRRLRIAGVVLAILFLVASAYQIIALSQPVTVMGH